MFGRSVGREKLLQEAVQALALQESLIIALAKAIGDREEIRRVFALSFDPATPDEWQALRREYLGEPV